MYFYAAVGILRAKKGKFILLFRTLHIKCLKNSGKKKYFLLFLKKSLHFS